AMDANIVMHFHNLALSTRAFVSRGLCHLRLRHPSVNRRVLLSIEEHLELHARIVLLDLGLCLDNRGSAVIRRASGPDGHRSKLEIGSLLSGTARPVQRAKVDCERITDIRARLTGRL